MNVLFINGSASPLRCGVGYYGENLISALPKDIHVSLLTTEPYGKETSNITLHHIHNWRIGTLPCLRRKIKAIGPDVIHIQYPAVGYKRELGINLLPLCLRIFYHKAPVVLTLHEYHSSALLGRIRTVITGLFVQKIIVSNESDLLALPYVLRKKASIIPISSNITKVAKSRATFEALLKKLELDSSLPTIAYFGFTNEAKGVKTLVESAPKIKANVLLLTELLADDPYQASVLSAIETAKSSGAHLGLAGYIDDAAVSEILQECDFFVLPQPLPLTAKSGTTIAAVQHGLVVVSTANQDPKLNLPYINNKNAVLLESMNANELAKQITALISEPSLLATIRNSLPELATYFSWEDIAKKHVTLYESFLQ